MVDCTGLENRRRESVRGFDPHSLLHHVRKGGHMGELRESIIQFMRSKFVSARLDAEQTGKWIVVYRVGDMHKEMGLKDRKRSVRSVMETIHLQTNLRVRLINKRTGPNINQQDGANIWFEYGLLPFSEHESLSYDSKRGRLVDKSKPQPEFGKRQVLTMDEIIELTSR